MDVGYAILWLAIIVTTVLALFIVADAVVHLVAWLMGWDIE